MNDVHLILLIAAIFYLGVYAVVKMIERGDE
jgi:hypothetical protein